MEIECRLGSCLTIREAGELFAVPKEKLNLEPRHVELHQLVAVQLQIGRGQDNITRLVGIFAIDEDHHAQLALEGDVPDQGRVEMDMVSLLQRTEIFKAAQVLKVDLAVILALRPAALRVRAAIEEQTVGVVAQLRDRVQLKINDCVNIFLFRKVAVYAVVFDAWGQALTLIAQLLLVEINAGLVLCLRARRLVSAGRRLGDRERERAPAGYIHDRQGRNFQPPFRAIRTAVEEVPETESLFAALRKKRGILGRDQFRTRIERRSHDALMKVRPIKGRPELARNRALGVVAVTAQIATGDAPAQGKDRGKQ